MNATPTPQPASVEFNATARTCADLAWLDAAGMPAPTAVSEALLVLFGVVVRHGVNGHLRLDRRIAGVLTVGATPVAPDLDAPPVKTVKVRLSADDHVVLSALADRIQLTEQDVVRHALLVLRTLTEHASVNGALTPVGTVATV